MPTDLGTIGAFGAKAGSDELKAMLALRVKAALDAQAQADRQARLELDRNAQSQQESQFSRRLAEDVAARAESEAVRRANAADSSQREVANNAQQAVSQSASGQDLTSLADSLKGNKYGIPVISAMKPEGTSASLPTLDMGHTGATGDVTGTGEVRGAGIRMVSPKLPPSKRTQMQDVPAPAGKTGKWQQLYDLETGQPIGQATPAYTPPQTGMGTLTPEDLDKVDKGARAVIEHRMSPSQAASLYGGMGNAAVFKREITNRVLDIDPKFNFAESESGYQFGKNPATQRTVRNIDNIVNTIPIMERLIGKAELAKMPIVNTATLGARKNVFADTDVANYQFMQTALADEFGQILGGGGSGSTTSDRKIQLALDALDKDMSPAMWKGVLATAKEVFATRRAALTKGTYLDQPTPAPAPTTKEYWVIDPVTKKLVKKSGGG